MHNWRCKKNFDEAAFAAREVLHSAYQNAETAAEALKQAAADAKAN